MYRVVDDYCCRGGRRAHEHIVTLLPEKCSSVLKNLDFCRPIREKIYCCPRPKQRQHSDKTKKMIANKSILLFFWLFGLVTSLWVGPRPELKASTLVRHNHDNIFFAFDPSNHHPEEKVDTAKKTSSDVAIFNFGPASARDAVLYTAERPGHSPPPRDDDEIVADEKDIQAWLSFMREQKVTNVIALLDDNEFDIYAGPGGLLQCYDSAGLQCVVQPMRDPDAPANIFRCVRKVEAEGGKVVAHCTGRIGRAGRVAAGWLVDRYCCTPAEATAEVLEQAAAASIRRKGSAEMLEAWLKNSDVVSS